jgi:IS30 family transposase
MSSNNNTTESNKLQPRKFTHLSIDERREIKTLLDDGASYRYISRQLKRSVSTISAEIKQGTTVQRLSNGKTVEKYFPDLGEREYEKNRSRCKSAGIQRYSSKFLAELADSLLKGKRSNQELRIHSVESFTETYEETEADDGIIPSVRTSYRIISSGQLPVKDIDLPQKPKRSSNGNEKSPPRGGNVKNHGTSISERPEHVLNREEFGHWEGDLVKGKKESGEPALLTLVERKSRFGIIIKVPNFESKSTYNIVHELLTEHGLSCFKSITWDNGSEFSMMSQLEGLSDSEHEIKVYFAHAYSSWERGTNENFNGLLREFIPKGQSISKYSDEYILQCEEALNSRPRKILGFKTAEQVYDAA